MAAKVYSVWHLVNMNGSGGENFRIKGWMGRFVDLISWSKVLGYACA